MLECQWCRPVVSRRIGRGKDGAHRRGELAGGGVLFPNQRGRGSDDGRAVGSLASSYGSCISRW
jgi:hypothetical protein